MTTAEQKIPPNPTVGFIGLGIMGRPMAINLLRAGYALHCYARRPEAAEPVCAAGAVACASPAEVARAADVVFTMVSDTPDVEQVVLGEQGVIQGARRGGVVVDMSTISPSATRTMATTLAEQGIDMLDAPVSGGEQGAVDGTLSIMVGGEDLVFQGLLPLFRVLGKNVVHVGGNGAGQVAKACNQIVVAQAMSAIGEAFVLAEAFGVDPAKVRQALLGGFAGSRVLEVHGQRMLDRDFEPGFKLKLHHKDMGIAMQAAHELGIALPGAGQAAQLINATMGRGLGELDSSALFLLQELLSLGGREED